MLTIRKYLKTRNRQPTNNQPAGGRPVKNPGS